MPTRRSTHHLGAALALTCTALLLPAAPASADLVRKTQAQDITWAATGAPPFAADPYPSAIDVSGRTDRVTGVKVHLDDVSHTYPDDLDLVLVGPNDAGVVLMSDAGGQVGATGVDLTFDDAAPVSAPDDGKLGGTYRPTNHQVEPDKLPPGTPQPPFSTSLSDAFAGTTPNGQWRLYAIDDMSGDAGTIGGWTLELRTGPAPYDDDPIVIADDSPPTAAFPYPRDLQVSGTFGTVEKVTVRLENLSHEDPGDIDIMLEGPTGARTMLMSDAGGAADVAGRNLHFDDDAPTLLPEAQELKSGSFRPTNHQGPDAFPAPAPSPPEAAGLDIFKGTDPNGAWKLWVVDDASGAAGTIANGVSISITMRSGVRFATGPGALTAAEDGGVKNLVVQRPEGGDAATVGYTISEPRYARDVELATGMVSFGVGQKTATLPATVLDDAGDERTEEVPLELTIASGDANAPADGGDAALKVVDDDMTDVRADFNGDGRVDQAVGAPKEDLVGGADAGAVQVLYAAANTGLSAADDQRFTQDSGGVPDVAEPGDQFGAAVAASDFDGDGYGDLAIGAPGEDDLGVADFGRVTILYGSPSGLTTAGALLLGQGSPGVPDDNEAGDRFGAALAAGNLGRGDRGDLAIGHPGEDLGALDGAGAVTTLYGTASGLGTAGATRWHQDTAEIAGTAEAGDGFGSVLAIGDLGLGAEGDLAVGVPAEDTGRGLVHVLYGTTATGIAAAGDQSFSQATPGLDPSIVAEAGDSFGAALATGQVGGSGSAHELAVGAPGEDLGGVADAGAAHVLFGDDANGLGVTETRHYVQTSNVINTGNGAGDRFGAAVAIGNFGGSASGTTTGDLAVGVPGETVGGVKAGAVQVIYGPQAPITGQQWHQGDQGIADDNEAGDQFGASLAPGRYRGPGTRHALSIGVPGEQVGQAGAAGGMAVLYPVPGSGLGAAGSQRWAQGFGGLLDAAEAGDGFGGVLAP